VAGRAAAGDVLDARRARLIDDVESLTTLINTLHRCCEFRDKDDKKLLLRGLLNQRDKIDEAMKQGELFSRRMYRQSVPYSSQDDENEADAVAVGFRW